MSKDEKGERIRKLSFFRNLDGKALDHLESAADEVTVSDGHVLIEQGKNHNEMLIIEAGGAEVLVDGEVVAAVPAGELLGELGLLDRGPATATVRAKGDTTLMVLPYNRCDQILEENPALVLEIARDLAARLRAMDARH